MSTGIAFGVHRIERAFGSHGTIPYFLQSFQCMLNPVWNADGLASPTFFLLVCKYILRKNNGTDTQGIKSLRMTKEHSDYNEKETVVKKFSHALLTPTGWLYSSAEKKSCG